MTKLILSLVIILGSLSWVAYEYRPQCQFAEAYKSSNGKTVPLYECENLGFVEYLP